MEAQQKKIIPCILAIITNEKGEVLFQKRNDPGSPAHDKWEFPGGGMEFGETPEQTLVREAKEETGYDVEIIRLLPKIYSNTWPEAQVLLIAYECKIKSGEYRKQDLEVSEGKFALPSEMDYSEALPYVKEIAELLSPKF